MKIKRILKDKGSIAGMAILPFILIKKNNTNPSIFLINHERIHLRQQLELFIIGTVLGGILNFGLLSFLFGYSLFYILYFLEWIIKSMINNKDEYRSISFEREAYKYERDLDYLNNKNLFSSFKMIRKVK